MNTHPISYPLHEGCFLTLPPATDQTINILSFLDPEHQAYDIIVNRAELKPDESVDDFLNAQAERMQRFTPGYTPEPEQIRHQIGPAQLPVVQTANKYLHQGKWMNQISSVITLPADPQRNPQQRKLIIFTLASHGEFTDAQRQHYRRMINSFTPEQTPCTDDNC
ncbi:DcrB-related protein [Tatumella sp. UBA2305]|uniref:DcrB-related protein n=1 Tax=Tatumella sp. UBA2305 TaxID=1947647 RepID=UPI0025F7102F|nr:DcrB-related protein [Tatumella sp. UBA2305]